MPKPSTTKALVTSFVMAVIALGFTFYLLLSVSLGIVLLKSGRVDVAPSQSAAFRHVALGLSGVAAVVTFVLFYRRAKR